MMVRSCYICKFEFGTFPDISVFSLPKNEKVRAQWFANIGKELSISSGVCSQHFESKFIDYKVFGSSVRRVLKPGAVPTLLLTQSRSCTALKDKNDSNTVERLACKDTTNLLDSTCQIDSERNVNADVSKQKTSKTIEIDESIEKDIITEKENITQQHMNEVGKSILHSENISETEDPHDFLSSSTSSSLTSKTSLKRNKAEVYPENKKRICSHRFIGDLTRSDFTNNTSWIIVKQHVIHCRRRQKIKNQKIIRFQLKNENFNELLKHLKKCGLLTNEGFNALDFSTNPALCEIIQNLTKNKKKNEYPSALKNFSCTLLFYSTAAYQYVRKIFLNSLPHIQTVRKWFSKLDFSPGISEQVMYSLKKMMDENLVKGVRMQFGIQVDEMSVKKQTEWDGKRFYGQVDMGLNTEEAEEATYALIVMLVCLNGHFKTPIAYYFIKSLTGEARANLLKEILIILSNNGINDIRSITFDGAATNIAMIRDLGADVNNINKDCYFQHPTTNEPIVVVPDACHMLKLTRNTLADFDITDENDNHIKWSFLHKLVNYQEKFNLYPATKIRRRHIEFQREKMKVKLAAQIFSTSVADALLFMLDLYPEDFAGVEATSIFCRKINNIFDALNSRRKFGKRDSEKCITIENLMEIEEKIHEYIAYIKSLKLYDSASERNNKIPILKSKRKMGFIGLIVALKSTVKLARYIFEKNLMYYLLTYKMSQDHLETFFSSIRQMGGFNNNPTCRQFSSSYKKIITHVHSIVPETGNCVVQDHTQVLKSINSSDMHVIDDDQINDIISLDHDYVGSNGWLWNEYSDEIVTCIAGSIIRSVKKVIRCEMCLSELETQTISSKLIKLKNIYIDNIGNENQIDNVQTKRNGLIMPSNSVIAICKTAEKTLRSTSTVLFTKKNILQHLIIYAKKQLISVEIFSNLDMFVEHKLNNNHKCDLISLILEKYFKIRLYHEARSSNSSVQRIRSFHNRIVLFSNQ